MDQLSYATHVILLGVFLICAVTCYTSRKILDILDRKKLMD
jgi:hypothetical protein